MTLSRPGRPAFNTQALNSAVGAILALDVEGRVTMANPRAVEITGYSLPELLGRSLLELLSAGEQPRLAALFQQALVTGESIARQETVLLRPDGEQRQILFSGAPLRDQGRVIGMTCTAEDLTETRAAESALHATEANLRAIFNSSLQAFVLLDAERTVRLYNRTARELALATFARPLSEGAPLDGLLPETLRGDYLSHFSLALEGRTIKTERRVEGRHGTRWFEFTYSPVVSDADRKPGVCLGILDVTDRHQAIEAVVQSEARFRALVQNSGDLILVANRDGVLLYCSPSVERSLGIAPAQLLGRPAIEQIHPDDAERVTAAFARLAVGGGALVLPEFRLRHHGGRWLWFEALGNPLPAGAGLEGVVLNARDISERRRTAQLEQDRNRLLEAIAASRPLSDVLEGLTALIAAQCPGLVCAVLRGVEPAPAAALNANTRFSAPINTAAGVRLGEIIAWGEPQGDFNAQPALEAAARLAALAIEQRALNDRLAFQAQHDALTGLPNRLLLEDRLRQAFYAASRRSGGAVGLLLIDLDRFKQVNDTLGHHTGDALLCEVAARLGGALRGGDTLARNGGDEFTLVAAGLKSPDDAARVAQRVQELLAAPFAVEGREFFLSASIGVAVHPQDGSDPETLQRNADSAMYRAKALGRNSFQCFAPEMNAAASERFELENELRRAAGRGELSMHYQSQVSLNDGTLRGAEALLRWQHPVHGSKPMGEVIQLAEESGLILALGDWVLDATCRQAAAWRAAGLTVPVLSVNVSPLQFAQPNFAQFALDTLIRHRLPAGAIELEVTESALMVDAPAAARKLAKLRSAGISFALDDFGSGYSSFGQLQRLPIDTLKIDQSFVRGENPATPAGAAILRAMASMGASLQMRTVAEGVEGEAELARVRLAGCDLAQGYHFDRPLPAAEFAQRLAAVRG